MLTQRPTEEVRAPVRDAIPTGREHNGPARDADLTINKAAPMATALDAAAKAVDAVSATARQTLKSAAAVPAVLEISPPTEAPMATLG